MKIIKEIFRLLLKLQYLNVNPLTDEKYKIWENAKCICLFATAGIGDAVMATPLIEAIRTIKPEARIIIIALKTTQEVFCNNPAVSKVYLEAVPNNIVTTIKLIHQLRDENIDVLFACLPSDLMKLSFLVSKARPKLSLKHLGNYINDSFRDLDFVYSHLLPCDLGRHRTELNLDFLRFLGEKIPNDVYYPKMFINEALRNSTSQKIYSILKNETDFIAIHAGGLLAYKHWDWEKYAAICQIILRHGYKIVLVGGIKEIEVNSKIVKQVGNNNVINFAGTLNLQETAVLLAHAKLLISNDTGIMHVAAAINTPVIAIFGPTDHRHIGPRGKNIHIIKKGKDINLISIEDVAREIERHM
jgi:lipopolysaccharide heptosyltransferase II